MKTILHYYNQRLIYCNHCADEMEAINIANDIVSELYQNGYHQVLVLDENNDDIFNQSFIVEDVGFGTDVVCVKAVTL